MRLDRIYNISFRYFKSNEKTKLDKQSRLFVLYSEYLDEPLQLHFEMECDLAYFEQKELYEVCSLIKDTIHNFGDFLSVKLQ